MYSTTHGVAITDNQLFLTDSLIGLLRKTFREKEIKRICVIKLDDECIVFTDDYFWSRQYQTDNQMELIYSRGSMHLRRYAKNGVYLDLAKFIVANANYKYNGNNMVGLKLAFTAIKNQNTHIMTKRVYMKIVK